MNRVVAFDFSSRSGKLSRRAVAVGLKTLAFLKKKNLFVEVYFLSDRAMRGLNRKSRGIDKPTNVLSFEHDPLFPVSGKKSQGLYLGEVYLAPRYIEMKKEDLDLLLIHGFLHLLGYTHETNRDRIRMERLEDKILSSLS